MIKSINHNLTSLKKPSTPATKADLATATNLLDTLKAHQAECVGMAANMIGVHKRIIVAQIGPFALAMINPKITAQHDPYQTTEGCLSLTGHRLTNRFKTITVSYLDQNFKTHTGDFSDFAAQIIQHEIDHCNGILI
ncbi:peptide deformylase [Furfurilactobacillus siliginis]|uniref:Peptide deformylase n=1 Tax=Furfurilactobacillus siliginis TaxID=348151 RepID=A0A0R2L6E4_9LACO|nr:peptide deformylase [Furfurilactobacillus siliginis]KRN97275.1 peptide deformylase [Furfurilactobacillus siliginis]GEK28586.1 peptide deformylase [Furfurilactobacillus siliginis]